MAGLPDQVAANSGPAEPRGTETWSDLTKLTLQQLMSLRVRGRFQNEAEEALRNPQDLAPLQGQGTLPDDLTTLSLAQLMALHVRARSPEPEPPEEEDETIAEATAIQAAVDTPSGEPRPAQPAQQNGGEAAQAAAGGSAAFAVLETVLESEPLVLLMDEEDDESDLELDVLLSRDENEAPGFDAPDTFLALNDGFSAPSPLSDPAAAEAGDPPAGGVAAIIGTDGDDTLNGTAGDDTIYARAGNDVVDGRAGEDSLHGEAGMDTLGGGAGDDTLYGGDGDDTLYGGNGKDYLDGGLGSDALYGGNGADVLVWDSNDSVIDGGNGPDTLVIGNLNDSIMLNGAFGGSLTDIETADLSGQGANTLALTAQDLLDITSNSNSLTVEGENGDIIDLVDAGGNAWSDDGIAGGYHVYSAAVGATTVTLLVDQDIADVNLNV